MKNCSLQAGSTHEKKNMHEFPGSCPIAGAPRGGWCTLKTPTPGRRTAVDGRSLARRLHRARAACTPPCCSSLSPFRPPTPSSLSCASSFHQPSSCFCARLPLLANQQLPVCPRHSPGWAPACHARPLLCTTRLRAVPRDCLPSSTFCDLPVDHFTQIPSPSVPLHLHPNLFSRRSTYLRHPPRRRNPTPAHRLSYFASAFPPRLVAIAAPHSALLRTTRLPRLVQKRQLRFSSSAASS